MTGRAGHGGTSTGTAVGAAPGTAVGTAPGTAVGTVPGTVRLPGPVNAHSHAFHRLLRGRTHGDGGSFWTWRTHMYDAAASLTPKRYEQLATAVFAEMAVTGWTAVGEFHYVHHAPDGTPYADHAMERALARAAHAVGIRLVLLDTLYLAGGLGRPLGPEQIRFGDADARAWLDRLASLRRALDGEADGLVTVGAAVHSVRAVPRDQLAVVAAELPDDVPLHVHLSEQPAENKDCLAAHGLTPTGLLDSLGLLSPRLSAVHATHLTEADIELLGGAGVGIVMCPTTEADLGDGIGPARALADAGAVISLGSDQHAVVDPFLEMRALEHGERLASISRGRFTPEELLGAATTGGRRSLGLDGGRSLGLGAGRSLGLDGGRSLGLDRGRMPATPDATAGLGAVPVTTNAAGDAGSGPAGDAGGDHVLVRTGTTRTAGSLPDQLPLTATAADMASVVVAGREIARDGAHTTLGDPGELLAAYLADHGDPTRTT